MSNPIDEVLALRMRDRESLDVSPDLFESMWELFFQIGVFWKNGDFLGPEENHDSFKSQLLVFLRNRIELDASYLDEYRNAQAVIAELKELFGNEAAYEKLFTEHVNDKVPPATPFSRARVMVSNEFVRLQLALGGFHAFGAANYPGYFGGANIEGQTPYRT